jgi:ABC-2 type transport system permease protein
MQAGRIRGLVVIPVDFAANMARANTDAPIQVITDGSEPNTANFVQGYVEDLAALAAAAGGRSRRNFEPLIDVQMRYWFNPAISQHFIIPGAVTIIMTVIGAILTSLVVAREWERGTMEALLSTEVTRRAAAVQAHSLLLPRHAGDAAVYAGVGIYSRRAVSRLAGDPVFITSLFCSARWGWGC